MAKEQRGNREAKKPKKQEQKTIAAAPQRVAPAKDPGTSGRRS
jgi:hypothetical protein